MLLEQRSKLSDFFQVTLKYTKKSNDLITDCAEFPLEVCLVKWSFTGRGVHESSIFQSPAQETNLFFKHEDERVWIT